MRFTRWLSIVTIAIALAVVTRDLEAQTVGQAFPDFFASDAITRQTVSLSDLRGRVVLVCFWASWCGPSCDEIPYIRDAYANYHDKGLEVISVSMDYDDADFRFYVMNNDMRWMQVMDGGGRKTRLAVQYGVHATPTNFLIDVNGTCVSSSLRTRRIAKAVEREIKRVKAKDLSRPVAAATVGSGPSLVTIFSNELVEMKGQIDDAAAPVDRFQERLKSARQQLEEYAASQGAREQSLWLQDLVNLRREMFISGLLNEHRAVLPTNQSVESVVPALLAVEAMSKSAQSVRVKADDLMKMVSSLHDRLQTEFLTVDKAQAQFNEAEKAVQVFASDRNQEWTARLLSLDEVLQRFARTDQQLAEQVAKAQELVNDVQSQLRQNPSGRRMMAKLRDDYSSMRSSLATIVPLVDGWDGRSTVIPADLFESAPGNSPPLESVAAQTASAASLAAQLGQRTAALREDSNRCVDQFSARIKSLQDEIKSAAQTAAKLNEMQNQFAALCGEILAAWD